MAGLLRASAVMASGTIVSRVLGLVKMMLLAYAIGAVNSVAGDSFTIGSELANQVYFLLIGGMLNAVLLPQIVRAAKDADGGRGYINKLLTLISMALIGITAIAMIAAPIFVFMNALTWPPEQLALATAFAYWCMPQILFYGLYVVLGEVLNAKSIFGPYTWAPVVNNIVGIVGILVFIVLFGADPNGQRMPIDWTPAAIAVIAGTSTLGVAAQAFILYLPWRRAGLQYRPDFRWRGMGLGRTVRIAAWSFGSLIVAQTSTLINNNVLGAASGEGVSVAGIQNVGMVYMVPHSVIAVSLATAYFTRLAEAGQSKRMTEYRADFSSAMRSILTVMTLAAVVLFTVAPYIARVLYFGSAPELVDQFWPVLQAYLLSLVAFSCSLITQRGFYALSDTRTPFMIVLTQKALLVALVVSIPTLFGVPGRYIGLAFGLCWSFAEIFGLLLGMVLLRRKIGAIDGRRIAVSFVRAAVAAVPALVFGIASWLVLRVVVPQPGMLQALLFGVVTAVLVALLYLGGLAVLRSPELAALLARVRPKK